MDRGGVYEIEKRKNCPTKMEMPLKWITLSKIFWTGTRMC